MKTKTFFKTLAAALLMPAMLLTTACSNEDYAVNTENTPNKGYALPATINVTRQGDSGTTRATYNESTRKLSFSTGDQLFVDGYDSKDENFSGILTWQSDGTFSGTIFTATEYEGTADQFLSEASYVGATLIPAGYEGYGYMTIEDDPYPYVDQHTTKAFAPTKAAAVEQFSWEVADEYDNGFALIPLNGIVSFTISGLTENKEIAVSFDTDAHELITGSVTADATGVATFAIGLNERTDLLGCELTVDGNKIELVNDSKSVVAGHIYNISRSVEPASPFANVTAADLGKIIGADGNIYDDAAAATAAGTTAVAKIAYVGNDAETSTTYNHGLALALSDVSGYQTWCSQSSETCLSKQYSSASDAKTDMAGLANTDALVGHGSHTHDAASAARNYNSGTHPTGTSEWFLPSAGQWDKMATAAGGYANLKTNAGLESYYYWSSSERYAGNAWDFGADDGDWGGDNKVLDDFVRACLAF